MRMILKSLALLLSLFMLAGCGLQSPSKKPQEKEAGQQQAVFDPGLGEAIKKVAMTVEGVEDSTVVVVNREISAAVIVAGFNRFRLKTIR
ncbi:MAG: YhcN/YlaJ family sporulation lipoprotein, partial [Desulfocucumaceae bacterium]